MHLVPPSLIDPNLSSYGKAETDQAVQTALSLASEWNLDLKEFLPGATCSLLLRAVQADGTLAVLKVPLDNEEATAGFQATHAFSGHGGVAVLEEDKQSGSVLMPLLGSCLAEVRLSDEEKVAVCARLTLQLHRADSAGAKPLESWFDDLESHQEIASVRRAKEIVEHLFATTDERVLLHGDLHHFNILNLRSEISNLQLAGWVAIDPKGVFGDPAFEPSAFIRNPAPSVATWPNLDQVTERRIERFSEGLQLPRERIWGWAFAQTVLAAVWSEGEFAGTWSVVAESLVRVGKQYERDL